MITDKCPACGKEYQWDAEQDTYIGWDANALEVELTEIGDEDAERKATVFYCYGCGTAVAIYLKDDNGASVFVPSNKEL